MTATRAAVLLREHLKADDVAAIAFIAGVRLTTARSYFAGRPVRSALAVLRLQRVSDILGVVPPRHRPGEGVYIDHDEWLPGEAFWRRYL